MDDNNKYGTRERQRELLVMLKKVDHFFQKHDISYSLEGGSLLGAIRHNGFIPWDDDVDLLVDRDNFNKILTAFNDHPNETPYHLNRYLWVYRIQEIADTSEGLLRPTIDIFVLDHCPDSRLKSGYKTFIIKMLQGMMKIEPDYNNKGLLMKICVSATHILGKMFSDEYLFKVYDSVSQMGNNEPSKYVAAYDYPFAYLDRRYHAQILDDLQLHTFEDTEFLITSEYEHYLTEVYGDYMTPPAEADRVSVHMS